MPRAFRYGAYSVYVLAERGQPHHLPHAHIRQRGRHVASIFILSLEVFDQVEKLPPDLLNEIAARQGELLAQWEELNGD
jgi:hypothetical protein